MYILGISCFFHDASAAIIKDGVLVAAAEEERFTRIKHDSSFPNNAIAFCLEYAGIEGPDLDYVVFFEKPYIKFERLVTTAVAGFPLTYRMWAQSMRTWLFDKLWIRSQLENATGIDRKRILFSEHHMSHAASAYYCSPFDNAAVLTFDGVGEWATTTIGEGKGTTLKINREIRFPHSIGLLYSAFTAFLGFEVNEGEYKVMGMAPYGTPRYVDKIWKMVHQEPDGSFWIDQQYFSFHHSTRKSFTTKFTDLFGEPRDPMTPFITQDMSSHSHSGHSGTESSNHNDQIEYNQYYADIAASIQSVTEELILSLVKEAHRQTGQTNLCMAGGVALNAVANGRILRETPIEQLYIQPSAGDGGGSLGAALYTWNSVLGNENRFVMDHAYWGNEYSSENISAALKQHNYNTSEIDDENRLMDMTVDRLLDGKVVGWFNGRFEWGPRALGNRSILADPRERQMKDIVNTKVKFREPFRPFAPSVLAEKASSYFDIPDQEIGMVERFMLTVSPIQNSQREAIPAVDHMGTARPQTVHRDTNPRFHELIRKFGDTTGTPVLLNTSLNVQGEPIVSTPESALNTFESSGLDTLVMGNFMIDREH